MKAYLPTTCCALIVVTFGAVGCTHLSNQDRGSGASPAAAPAPAARPAPHYASLRTPLVAQVKDRTFRTKEAMYLANEMSYGGFDFFEQAMAAGLGVGDADFQQMTTVESYWYSRYNMMTLTSESRLGVHVVYGPYVTEAALREGRALDNRDRGEYVRSNKGVLLQEILPAYQARTGFPRRFEDASPAMLQFASGDPHFVRPVDKGTNFESTENLQRDAELRKIYGASMPARAVGQGLAGSAIWKARVNYRENFLTLRWNENKMDHTIDLGAEGQALMKEALWMEYYFKQSHHDGRYLGNDPEEGFRGATLHLMAVSKMLMLKCALLTDGRRLLGADPRSVQPGALYFPHRVGCRMRLIGDLPPRPEEFDLADASSQLFDQASLLWGLSEYYHFADPSKPSNWNRVFGAHPGKDGSLMEQKYLVLAEGLAGMIFRNLGAMHQRPDGRLVSEWLPGSGQKAAVSTCDLGMSLLALANYQRYIHAEPAEVAAAQRMLAQQADFLVDALQAADGSVADHYDFSSQTADSGPRTLLAQGFALRGLLEAYKELQSERYLTAARRIYGFMNTSLWDERTGIYRSEAGATVSVFTPLNLGAALGGLRECILLTKDQAGLERYKRFWVQAVNSSGIQQSEYEETGEKDLAERDGDGDGIPRMEFGDGKYGVAPVFASRVEIETP